MALRMMSAIVTGSQSQQQHQNEQKSKTSSEDHVEERLHLQQELMAAAKQCHIRFGGKSELATESDSCVTQLCVAFDKIFNHGLRNNTRMDMLNSALRQVSELVSKPSHSSFWSCIKELLSWHEQERFNVLKKVHTEEGRARAWLRAALNERSLERHLHALLALPEELLLTHYHNWAFLLDQDSSAPLPSIAAGLSTILFAVRIDNELLDRSVLLKTTEPSEPIIVTEPAENRVVSKKTVRAQIVTFDDDDEDGEEQPQQQQQFHHQNHLPLHGSTSSSEPTPMVETLLTPLGEPDRAIGSLVPVSVFGPEDIVDSELEAEAEAALEALEPFEAGADSREEQSLSAEEMRLRLIALGEAVEQAREDAVSSKLQLARFRRQHQNYLERHELQVQTLNRENELLRQQLRKYVTAVQMLKRDSDSESGPSEQQPTDFNYHEEANEYQNKLVQVAEMHAELMEFNSRLTMELTNKDRLVKILRAELECLRGPINEEDLPTEAPCLIHIWIPSAFLTGQPSDIHHVYQIYVRIRDTEWNIYRRYAQFYSLYRELKKHDAIVTSFDFPPKKTIGNKDAKFVEERRIKLQQWLRRIVNRLSHCSPAFSTSPTKQTLISLMPFFGEFTNGEAKRNNSARNTYSSSPQYMGL